MAWAYGSIRGDFWRLWGEQGKWAERDRQDAYDASQERQAAQYTQQRLF